MRPVAGSRTKVPEGEDRELHGLGGGGVPSDRVSALDDFLEVVTDNTGGKSDAHKLCKSSKRHSSSLTVHSTLELSKASSSCCRVAVLYPP
jgi:hypothetical protein